MGLPGQNKDTGVLGGHGQVAPEQLLLECSAGAGEEPRIYYSHCLSGAWTRVAVSYGRYTNDCKCSGLKQQKFIILQPGGQISKIIVYGLNPRC